MNNCSQLGIPEHLHKNNRTSDNDFSDDELLFRRYRDEKQIFSTSNMSVNRRKYGKPEDVLYNTVSNEHFFSWGIRAFETGKLREFQANHPENPSIKYSVTVKHSPSKCMYPHSEVIILENGSPLDTLQKPKSVRTLYLLFCQQISYSIKEPSV